MAVVFDLAQVYLVVFLINLAPGFMPPTWSVLAFFLLRGDLPLLPLALGGAVAATAGRLTLALASRRWGRRLLPPDHQANLIHLGRWLDTRAAWTAPVAVLFYSFGPIPSNELFIAAGFTGMRLWPIAAAFFVGRILSYTFFVTSARVVSDRFEALFLARWGDLGLLAIELAALGVLVLFTRVDWPKRLPLPAVVREGASPDS